MSISLDGNSLIFDGTVTFTNFNDPSTGVCTMTLTPSGGLSNLPALSTGAPGMPALFTSVSVTTLAAGAQATASVNQVSPGGEGQSSEYSLALGIPQGLQGATSSFAMADATDLTGSPVAGDVVTVASTGPTAFQYSAMPFGFVANGTVNAVTTSGNTTQTLSTVSFSAKPYDWYPVCFAAATVNGTVNTVLSLQATLNATNGNVVGAAQGLSGAAIQRLTMIPGFGEVLSGGYGLVAAGASAEIFLTAQQSASVSDGWSVSGTNAYFTVFGFPVPS